MKTYLFDTFNRYKRFSEELDAKTILCNKSWWVFNDSGEKELYIFNTDGTLIIAVSGKVTNATWQYIPANKSLIISGNNQSYMVKPAFYDNQIFALQVDGTNDYAFLIDENKLPSTNLKSLSDLVIYFAEKERQAVLAEERKQQAAIEAQRQREIKAQQQRKEQDDDSVIVDIVVTSLRVLCIMAGIAGIILLFYLITIISNNLSDIDVDNTFLYIVNYFWDDKENFKLLIFTICGLYLFYIGVKSD